MSSSKLFIWSDLRKIPPVPGSRFNFAITFLLEGQRVDLSLIPRRQGFRAPCKVRRDLKRLLAEHEGVVCEGNVFWIPDLYGKSST